MIPVALTIAGSDPSGGAGIQADLKTFHQFGVYGMSVLTLLTVQNTCQVRSVKHLPADFVLEQLDAVLEDIPPQAAKTGALGTRDVIEAVAQRAATFSFPLIVDPVMLSKHGAPLLDEDARTSLIEKLLPHAYLVTPNLHEAMALAAMEYTGPASLQEAAKAIADFGPGAVLIKGGHLEEEATDILFVDGDFHCLTAGRVQTRHTHGTGCTYSAAITAALAKDADLLEALQMAKTYITRAIETNPSLGHGSGPVNHFAPFDSNEH
ncbi:MAG: bifunctional hydroxymethylpyrimidine kinase/phosphomethylpyrimidine kinase [Acidobacteria bacterium]|nr:bifunctional hydroxymethylpyrimidine kinase/phosphomethylpyrimidine kinase [Acidobacteriota bacterium]